VAESISAPAWTAMVSSRIFSARFWISHPADQEWIDLIPVDKHKSSIGVRGVVHYSNSARYIGSANP
jgi:hypothetical protein